VPDTLASPSSFQIFLSENPLKALPITLVLAALAAAPVLAQTPPAPAPVPAQDPQQDPEGKEKAKPVLLELGKTLPKPIALPDIDGEVHRSQQYAGKVVVVNFWSTTCPIMKGWESRYAAIHRAYAEQGVVFLTINSNEGNGEIGDREPKKEGDLPYQKIRDHLKAHELPYEVLVDHQSQVADLFQARTTPDIFVFDSKGVLVYRGLIDDDPRGDKGEKTTHHLKTVLDALLAGEAVEPLATKPIGCGIKRPAAADGGRRRRG
jgi:peroxiredoxin